MKSKWIQSCLELKAKNFNLPYITCGLAKFNVTWMS
jgi:hypothetical protein